MKWRNQMFFKKCGNSGGKWKKARKHTCHLFSPVCKASVLCELIIIHDCTDIFHVFVDDLLGVEEFQRKKWHIKWSWRIPNDTKKKTAIERIIRGKQHYMGHHFKREKWSAILKSHPEYSNVATSEWKELSLSILASLFPSIQWCYTIDSLL